MTNRLIHIALQMVALFLLLPAFGEEVEPRKLLSQGKKDEAFVALLAQPGGAFAALTIARDDPEHFLGLLNQAAVSSGALLVKGDLLLAQAKKTEALECYRQAGRLLLTEPLRPTLYAPLGDCYPVEPADALSVQGQWFDTATPFQFGPGSHRDNWLLRRLIALEAWPEASLEFDRVWRLHRGDGTQFSSFALQFALDYAFFLRERKQTDAALGILLEPLLILDLDRRAPHVSFSFRGTNGTSAKEFIRLAHGAFKDAGKEDQLGERLQKQIEAGVNRARRILARVRSLQGNTTAALELELKYIEEGGFVACSADYRKGVAYQDALNTAKAIEFFEKVLKSADDTAQLPDPEENVEHPLLGYPARQFTAKSEARMRLRTLYQGSGNAERVLELVLADFDAGAEAPREHSLTDLRNQFRVAGKEAEFANWALIKAAAADSPQTKAEYFLAIPDYAEARKSLASRKGMKSNEIDSWASRFAKAGDAERQRFLESMLAADPGNAYLGFILKNGGSESKEIAALEAMLDATEDSRNFSVLQQEDAEPFSIAYRLMHFYEKNRDLDKMEKLAMRLALLQKPFQDYDWEDHRYSEIVRAPEKANAAISLAIPYVRNREALRKALAESPWIGARSQLERVVTGKLPEPFAPASRKTWANLPESCELYVSDEKVLSLARDEQYLYSGHPWGIAVRDFQGQLVRRVLLGEPAEVLSIARGELWAGTPKGLFRISPGKGWAVAHQGLHGDLPAKRQPELNDEREYRQVNTVRALCEDGPSLWIGLGRNVQVLDIEKNTLHVYSPSEWGVTNSFDTERIVTTPKYVWVSGRNALVRFERATGRWQQVEAPGSGPVQLIGEIRGRIFGSVHLNESLRARPCIINPDTLEVVPVSIEGKAKGRQLNGPFTFSGIQNEDIILEADSQFYRLNEKAGSIVANSVETTELNFPTGEEKPDDLQTLQRQDPALDSLHHLKVALLIRQKTGALPKEWMSVELPGGGEVFGTGQDEGSDEYSREIRHNSGGLFFVYPDGRQMRVSSPTHSGGMPGDRISAVLEDQNRLWICANGGLVLQSEEGFRVFRRQDGLCSNRITSAALVNGVPYFGTGWGDSGGGLMYWDAARSVFGVYFSENGMDTNKIASLQMDGERLRLSYSSEYMRYRDYGYRQCQDGWFDPKERTFQSGGEPRKVGRETPPLPPMPLLGGGLVSKRSIRGKTYLCGSRGLLVYDGDVLPEWKLASLNATQDNVTLVQLNEAASKPFKYKGPADVITALDDPNPFYRAKVLAGNWKVTPELFPKVSAQMKDPELRVRGTALIRMQQSKLADELVLPIYENALPDTDPQIRGIAALELLKRGKIPPLAIMKEFFGHRQGQLLYGMDSSMGGVANRESFYLACAAHANADIFALLLADPPAFNSYDYKESVYPKLGASLTAHPEALDQLLRAYGEKQTKFVSHVFRFAGADLLPRLHEALRSPDRVVRSNAARACGEIGQAESAGPLLAALDLPSGLSQASIVWALGNIRSRDALPILQRLYVDTRNDDARSAGFKFSQSVDTNRSQFSGLQDLQSVGREWSQLKPEGPDRPLNPQRDEELLKTELILEAIASVGAEFSQPFYRSLAGEKNPEGRRQAAVYLISGDNAELTENLPILRTLSADEDREVGISAAVTLFLLKEPNAARLITNALKSDDDWIVRRTLKELKRATTAELLFELADGLRVTAGNAALSPGSRAEAQGLLKQLGTTR